MSRRKLKEEEGQKSLEIYITPKSDRIKQDKKVTPKTTNVNAKRRTPPSAEGPVQKRLNLEPTTTDMEIEQLIDHSVSAQKKIVETSTEEQNTQNTEEQKQKLNPEEELPCRLHETSCE